MIVSGYESDLALRSAALAQRHQDHRLERIGTKTSSSSAAKGRYQAPGHRQRRHRGRLPRGGTTIATTIYGWILELGTGAVAPRDHVHHCRGHAADRRSTATPTNSTISGPRHRCRHRPAHGHIQQRAVVRILTSANALKAPRAARRYQLHLEIRTRCSTADVLPLLPANSATGTKIVASLYLCALDGTQRYFYGERRLRGSGVRSCRR